MKTILKSVLLSIPICLVLTTFTVDFARASVEISQTGKGKIAFKALDSSIEKIVDEFNNKFSVKIDGLKSKKNSKITFSFEADTVEELLKGLLRHLGIKNFALEFADASLKRVVVVPGATSDISAQPLPQSVQPNQQEFVNVAQIQSVIASSQAEALGLLEGDIIIEYDGVQITNAQQLVKEVEKKASTDQVELVVVRDKDSRRFILKGGFIGVRIITKKIAKEELGVIEFSE
jgi:C-terminal processing protease CtpA/Prc